MKLLQNNWIFTLLALMIFVIGGYLLYQSQQSPELNVKGGDVKTPQTPQETPKVPGGDTSQGGHFHDDGTFHAQTHEAKALPAVPAVQNTAPPGAITTPDFPVVDPKEDPVEAAYKRLEYIKNNPYAWGGVHSPRATELIEKLMPPPVLIDHAHGEVVGEQIDELIAQGDPRAAEVIITNMCDGYIGGKIMTDALVEIGPPAVPYILPYLEEGLVQGGTISIGVFRALGRIGAEHRRDLGGIVEHIIIPKIAVIAADSDFERFGSGTVIDAREALSMLQ